ncbi:MAG: hypothetical protein D6724_02015 [Armatimonadetes bacterium]|nr:MAG: hypothetical protein D6724_02015 [Armatimonadota bacterium]
MKLKLSTFLVLLVCALAATTSLTPIVAKANAKFPAQGTEADCRALLSEIVNRINAYRQQHNGDFPLSLNEVGGPFVCPEHFTPIVLGTGQIHRPDLVRPEGLAGFQALARSIDWNQIPIVECGSHFDSDRVINVMWIDRSEQNLPPRPMPVPAENTKNAFLGATLDGRVGYYDNSDDAIDRVAPFFERLPYIWR